MTASTMPDAPATARRILLVEDNYLVASMLQQKLGSLGCVVIGPAPSVEKGMQLAQDQTLDGAILDINILGGTSAPIADVLTARQLPFVFITGYASPPNLPPSFSSVPRFAKPLDDAMLVSIIESRFQ